MADPVVAPCVFFNRYTETLARGDTNFGVDVYKAYLTNTAPNVATNVVKSDLPEISMTNEQNHGPGGADMNAGYNRSGSKTNVTADGYIFAGGPGGVGPFRYVVMYNTLNDYLVSYWDYGASISLSNNDTLTVAHGGLAHDIDIA